MAANKSAAVQGLLATLRTVAVWPNCSHQVTVAEAAVLATEPMQRLRRLRQIGLAYHALPMAEHTRFSHSLGTAYWASRMLEAVWARTPRAIEALEDEVGPNISLHLLVRLFALIHDMALLPLGHTLRFQLALFAGHNVFSALFRDCLERVVAAAPARLAVGGDAASQRALEAALATHLTLAGAVAHVPRLLVGAAPLPLHASVAPEVVIAKLPILTFVYDVVHGVYGADLIDICVRDLFAAGRRWTMPATLLPAGAVFRCTPQSEAWPRRDGANGHGFAAIHRYGVQAVDAKGRVDTAVLTDLLHVHSSRFDIAEKAFYAPAKCIADAMLGKLVRRLHAARPAALERLLMPERLIRMGDDILLDALVELEQEVDPGGPGLAMAIRDGALYEDVLALDALSTPGFEDLCEQLKAPEVLTMVESSIAAGAGLDASDVIIGLLPASMQGKSADTLVGWHGGRVLPFDVLASEVGFPAAAGNLLHQYRRLRRLTVCTPRRCLAAPKLVASARAALALKNVQNMPSTVKASYPDPQRVAG